MAPTSAETCAALCDDIAAKVHPDFDLLFEHGADVESTADAMLARLDELGAMLGTPQMQQMMQGGANEGADLKNKADAEIDRILEEQYARGMKLLTDNRDVLDAIAKILIENEKINGKELLKTI